MHGRGNVGHAELEDFMFRNPRVNDFKAEACAGEGLDVLRISIEVGRGEAADK